MSPQRYKVGICLDGKRHAAVRSWFQRRALCGAGRIVLPEQGLFYSKDLLACRVCAAKVNGAGEP